MKRFLILFLAILPMSLMAQLTFELKGLVNEKISSDLPEGTRIELKKIVKNKKGGENAILLVNNEEHKIGLKQFDKITFQPTNSKQFWQNQMIQHSVFENIMKNGLQYGLRRELEEDAIEYIDYLVNSGLTFDDDYLESYIYSLVYKIYPNKIDDGRPGIVNVKIIKNLSPNAGIYSNGTMVINTGLLSTINSEEELIAVLAHEVAHFVLDHSIININKAEKRKKRAEFWAALTTSLAVASDVLVSSNNNNYNYVPGTIAYTGAILSYSIASTVNQRLGLKFSRQQEMEADKCAVELMKSIKVNETALSSALNKIKQYCIVTGNYLALTGRGSHPAIDDRIEEIGVPGKFGSIDYDKTISFVNSDNSVRELRNQHFSSSAELVKRNIEANIASEEDYVLMAQTTLFMYDTVEKNNEALSYINKAKALNIYPVLDMYKQEAIVLIRLNRMNDAKNSLLVYEDGLNKKKESLSNIIDPNQWASMSNYISKEYRWTRKMLNKVSKL
jgi:beta-barrel assembly-enhancing protease